MALTVGILLPYSVDYSSLSLPSDHKELEDFCYNLAWRQKGDHESTAARYMSIGAELTVRPR